MDVTQIADDPPFGCCARREIDRDSSGPNPARERFSSRSGTVVETWIVAGGSVFVGKKTSLGESLGAS